LTLVSPTSADPAALAFAVFWWLAFEAFHAAGHNDEALQALEIGARWIQAATPHVPEVFRRLPESQPRRSALVGDAAAPARPLSPSHWHVAVTLQERTAA
jgi:hypothetical protein